MRIPLDSKFEGAIMSTRDYDAFGKKKGNREVKEVKVVQIKGSMGKKNMIHLYPIGVDSNYDVLDGQHRLAAARELGLPIHYIVPNDTWGEVSELDIAMANSASSPWPLKEYLNAFCVSGVEDYLRFRDFLKRYEAHGFSITAVLSMVLGRETSGRGFKVGKFEFSDADSVRSGSRLEKIIDFKEHFPVGYNKKVFVLAYIVTLRLDGFDHEKMIQKLDLQPTVLKRCAHQVDYYPLFEEIYNYCAREKLYWNMR